MLIKKYNLKIDRLPESQLDFLKIDVPHNNILKINKKINKLSKIVDLTSKMPPIYDQWNLGSCTYNALCGLIGYDNPSIIGSRLFLYYNERKIEKHISIDSCAQLYDGIKCLTIYGICQESDWPYDITKFTICPTIQCYNNALGHKALQVKI